MKRLGLGFVLAALTIVSLGNALTLYQLTATLNTSRRPQGPDAKKVHAINLASAPTKGSETAKVTIVEFSDFQCPACSQAAKIVRQVEHQYAGRIRVAYKHMPLTSIHPFATGAAVAAEAARNQGKFWEFHDVLFANQSKLDAESLRGYAADLGLDLARYDKDIADKTLIQRIGADVAEAQTLGLSFTPTFFVNGRFVRLTQGVEDFARAIDEELAKR